MWPWRRGPAPAPRASAAAAFDAVIDLAPAAIGALPAGPAMAAATHAIRAIPGAAMVRVRLGDGPDAIAVRLFPPGRAEQRTGERWSALHGTVAATALAALQTIEPPHVARRGPIPLPQPVSGAFAEAPQPFDPLAELAALAQSVRTPADRPRPAPDPADAVMLGRLLSFVLPEAEHAAAAAALRRFGSYAATLAATDRELRQVPGLGPHSVAAIKLVHEAAIRLARAGVTGQPVLDDPARLSDYLLAALARARVEQFRILFLDASGMLRADEVQATGTVNHTPVYPREVIRRALELGAAAVVLVHNHPSGDPTPSPEDLTMTAEITRAAAALGIAVRDHVIVGNGRTLSFREAGLLP